MAEELHVGEFLGLDFKAELALDDDYDVDEVETVNTDVFFEAGFGGDFLRVFSKSSTRKSIICCSSS